MKEKITKGLSKRILSFVLMLAMVLTLMPSMKTEAMIGFEEPVINITLYPSGCLKSMDIDLKLTANYGTAYGRVAVHNENVLNNYNWGHYYKTGQEDWSNFDEEELKRDAGLVAIQTADEAFDFTVPESHNTVEFEDGVVDLNTDQTYYVYLWSRQQGSGYIYIHDLIKELKTENGQLKTEDGNIIEPVVSHTHNWAYKADGATLKAYCTETEGADGCDHQGSATDLSKAVSLTLSATSANYSGSAATITIGTETERTAWTTAGLTVPTTISYETAEGAALTEAPTTVGSYVAKVSPVGETATADNTAKVSFTIAKAEPTATAPTAVASLTYTGEAQNLVTAGSTSDGTLQYALSQDGPFTTGIPQGTNAGDYSVYYKVAGDAEHGDKVFETPVSVTIAKATIADDKKPSDGITVYVSSGKESSQSGTVTLTTLGINTTVIPGAEISAVVKGADTNNIIASVSDATYTTATNLTAGNKATLTVTISSTNYADFTYDLTVEVKAKTELTIGGISAPTTNPTYTGNSVANSIFGTPTVTGIPAGGEAFTVAELVYTFAGRDGTVYSASATAPTNVGKYTLTVAVPESNENYYGSVTIDFEIVKSTPTAPNATGVAPTSSSATDGKVTGVNTTMEYAVFNTTSNTYGEYQDCTGTEITDLAAGTKIKVRVKATENNNVGAEKKITVPAYETPYIPPYGPYYPSYDPVPSVDPTLVVEDYKVPVEGDKESVRVNAEIKNGEAVVAEITANTLKDIVKEATKDSKTETSSSEDKVTTITINLSGSKQEVTGVTLSKASVNAIAKVINDDKNTIDKLEIQLTNATITLDATAVNSLSKQAKGKNIQLVVEEINPKEKLNTAQQNALKSDQVSATFDVYLMSDNEKIHTFDNGKLTFSIEFKPEKGKQAKYYHIVYIDDKGNKEYFPTTFVGDDIVFTTDHCSNYAIVYDTTKSNDLDKKLLTPVQYSEKNGNVTAKTFLVDQITTLVNAAPEFKSVVFVNGPAKDFKFKGIALYRTTGLGWASSNTGIAGVTATGVVLPKKNGVVTVSYRDKFMPAAVARVAVVDKSKTNKLKIVDQNSSTKATLTFKVGDEIDYRFMGCTEWVKAKSKDSYWDSYNDDIFLCVQATAGKFVAMKPGKTKVALAVYCDGKIVGYDEIEVEVTK